MFSTCTNKDLIVSNKRQTNNSEYRTLQIEDKIYILFANKEPGDCFEI